MKLVVKSCVDEKEFETTESGVKRELTEVSREFGATYYPEIVHLIVKGTCHISRRQRDGMMSIVPCMGNGVMLMCTQHCSYTTDGCARI